MSSIGIESKLSASYILGKTIGSGGQAEVRLAECRPGISPSGKVAVKIAKITTANPKHLMDKEISLLSFIEDKDPNGEVDVVRYYGSVSDPRHVALVLELCSGGELFDDILDNGKYSEHLAAVSVNTMTRTLSHLKQMGVIHRDIKPENFVYSSKGENRHLKLIDFGMACLESDADTVKKAGLGTPAYQAPEIFQHHAATSASDVWSLGVVLFIMLSGTFPFNPNHGDEKLKQQILSGKFAFSGRDWQNISEHAKDLITKMLTVDIEKRITLAEILVHPWLATEQAKEPFSTDYYSRLRAARAVTEFRGAVRAMVVAKKWMKKSLTQMSDPSFSMGIDSQFMEIAVSDLKFMLDQFKAGAVDFKVDFPTFAKVVSSVYACRAFCSFLYFNMFDPQGLDGMDYRKFLLALASLRKVIDDEWVQFCFDLFDENGDKTICTKEFSALASSFCGSFGDGVVSPLKKRSNLAQEMVALALPGSPSHSAMPPRVPVEVAGEDFPIVDDEYSDEDEDLWNAFKRLDTDQSGLIDFAEFKDWLIMLYGQGKCTLNY